ncbi:MAG: extracellular solute-binding protein [Bacteroidota bacterium]
MYYRRDLIRALPDGEAVERRLQESITWDELAKLRRRLGYNGRPSFVFPAKAYEGLVCYFLELAVSHDSQFLAKNDLPMKSTAAMQALRTLVNFVGNGTSPADVAGFDENLSYRWFLDHDAVFVRGWPNFIENFRRFYPDTAKLEAVGRAPLPHVAGQKPSSVFGGWNLMVSRSSAKKSEAMEFIRYLQSPEAQRMLFEGGGYIPIRSDLYRDSSLLASHPELSFYHALLQRGFHRPMLVDYTRASDIASHFLHRAITGEITVEDALARADDMIRSNALLLK